MFFLKSKFEIKLFFLLLVSVGSFFLTDFELRILGLLVWTLFTSVLYTKYKFKLVKLVLLFIVKPWFLLKYFKVFLNLGSSGIWIGDLLSVGGSIFLSNV